MAIDRQIPVSGTAVHRVSEAICLTDPEGNEVEIYYDRPNDTWSWGDGEIQMGTIQLDVDGIMDQLGQLSPNWQGAAAGHVHLKVGDAPRAARWWQDALGFDAVSNRPDAVFVSTGGYHHHIAVNHWVRPGAGRRSAQQTGLNIAELRRNGSEGAVQLFEDDWRTQVKLV